MFGVSREIIKKTFLLPAVLCLTLLLTSLVASAQQGNSEESTSAEDTASEIQTAPVKLDGETLFWVRGISAYPAEKRAAVIAGRIEAVAKDRGFDPQKLRLNETQFASQVMAGHLMIVTFYDEDARVEGVERQSLARACLTRMQEAMQEYRQQRQPKVLIRHALYGLAAALALFLVLLGGWKIVERARRGLERRFKHRIREVGIQQLKVLSAERLWAVLITILNLAAAAAGLAATYLALAYILSLFPWTRAAGYHLSEFVLDPLSVIGQKVVSAIPDLIFLLLLGVITHYLLKFIRLIFNSIEIGGIRLSNFDPSWAKPTYRLVRVFVIAFALVIAFPYIPGSSTQAFKGVSLFIGLVFSLGSTSLIGNLVSGYSLTYRKAFKPGDRVKIGAYVGDVQDSRLLVTYLQTPKNEIIAVPNSSIVNSEVINYSSLAKQDGLILHTTVGIGYETPWRQVEAMLLEAAARTPGLLREPKPFVRETLLRSFDVEYELNAYCNDAQQIEFLYPALHRNILDLFNEYQVQIMTPAYVADPQELKIVGKERLYAAPAVANSTRPDRNTAANAVGSGTE